MRCVRCGTENPEGAKFCTECAARLPWPPAETPPAPAGSPETVDVSRASDAHAADAERKLVTVLFADVAGFTTLAETLDPEPLRDLINACFGRLVPCVERYGGTVDKFIGDEIMALFGAPVAHDNDPERAVRAALDMREALQAFNAERGTALQAHIGLNTGLVLAGAVGAGSRTEYSVMGDAVNVASRLAETSAPGEILVGPDTHRRAGHLFQCEEAGPVRIRGRVEALTVYRVLGARAATGPAATRPGRWVGSPLVGRGREKEAFVAALDRVLQGEGGILAVVADAGLGKSRLTAEVRRLAGPELTWLEGRTLSFGRAISYWPFLELLQSAAGIDSDDDEAERSEKLERLVGLLFAEETTDVLPYLATFLSLPVPEELQDKVRYLDGEAMGRQVFRTMRLFVSHLAGERPLILVFEDVHWLDGSSVELLEHLLPLTKEAPVLVCLVGRPEPDSPTLRLQHLAHETYADRYEELLLAPLSAEETRTLVGNLVGRRDLPVGLREAIDHKAEGNPFFVEEVIRALVDRGGLVPDERGGWQISEKAQEITIPDTLQGVIMGRIDRLDEELKQVLRLAAVIGRSFFYRVLRSLSEAERRLDDDIATLRSLELVREKAREPELEYIFKHALVQEATYESILLQRRKALHGKVAATIEDLFADRLEEFYGLLAYHYTKAEDWEKAQEYLLKAGDQAGRVAADAEALEHYEQAMEAHAKAFGDTWDPFERSALERKIGEALYRRGDMERAREHLYRAMTLLGYPLPTSRGTVRRTLAVQVIRQLGHRVLPWRPRRRVSEDRSRTLGELLALYDPLYMADMMFESERALLDGALLLNIFEQGGFDLGIAKASSGMGLAGYVMPIGAAQFAGSYAHRSLKAATRTGDQDLLAWSTLWTGIHEHFIGEWASARERYADAASSYITLGDIRNWGTVAGMTCNLLLEVGELEGIRALASECVRRGQESGDRVLQAWGEVCRGDALCRMGRLAEAEIDLRAALAGLLGANDFLNVPRTVGPLAHCLLRQRRTEEAAVLIDDEFGRLAGVRAIPHFSEQLWTASATLNLARLEQAADADREQARRAADQACRGLLKNSKLDKGGFVPGYRMMGTYEWLAGRPRNAEKCWRKSLAVADQLGARYQEALTRLEIGRRLCDRGEVEQAEALFVEMGAALDLAETRHLLGP